jgi:5-formaminoimidazole-4-carboxamide-1-beta-D-ribofuranosyl 5'-monophosphate synthetase
MEIVVIDISGRIVSGSNLEMGTEHVMDVQRTCHGCP